MIEEESRPSQQESIAQTPYFTTPFCHVVNERFEKKHPSEAAGMNIALREIDRQAVSNFNIFNSQEFPGVAFSYTELLVTPEVVEKIAATGSSEEKKLPTETSLAGREDETHFVFTSLGLPPGSHAFTSQDLGIDVFLQLLTPVVNALKNKAVDPNTKIPQERIYLVGFPIGFGGKITTEFNEAFKSNGFTTIGKLGAEFVRAQIAKQQEAGQTTPGRIVLQGASLGAATADYTRKSLPEELQKQVLIDNPVGMYQRTFWNQFRKLQVVLGFAGEFAIRMGFDEISKGLGKRGEEFLRKMKEEKHILEDTKDQEKLKMDTFLVVANRLINGVPLDPLQRTFAKRALYDPLSASVPKIIRTAIRGKKFVVKSRGKVLEVATRGTHAFTVLDREKSWARKLRHVKSYQVPTQ